jgi:hypothetical protein
VTRALGLLAVYAVVLLGLRLVPQHDVVLASVVLFFALRFCERRPLGVFAVATVFLALNLAWLWRVGFAGRHHVFGGVIALSDAHGYYEDAVRAFHGLPIARGGVRRPLAIAVLGGILKLTGGHIRLAMIALMFAWAGATACVIREIKRTHGSLASSLVGIAFLFFARRYVGIIQPEGFSGPIGAFAFCMLWRAVSSERFSLLWAGALLLLTIGLLARPGPFTAVIGVVAWAWRTKALRDRRIALGIGAVVLGWGMQKVVQHTMAPSGSFSDMPPILYGMLHGEDHTFLPRTHPGLSGGQTIALVGHELAERPLMLPIALVRCFASHIVLPQGLFGFVFGNPDDRMLEGNAGGALGRWISELGIYSLLNFVVMALVAVAFVIGFVWALIRARRKLRDEPHVQMLLFAIGGAMLSWLLLPPWITEGAQMHVTVITFFFALPAVVFFGRKASVLEVVSDRSYLRVAIAIPTATLALIALTRILSSDVPRDAHCEAGHYLAAPDPWARVTFGEHPSPTVAPGDARANIARLKKRNGLIAAELEAGMGRSSEIVPVLDACSGDLYYFLDDHDRLAGAGGWQRLEGRLISPAHPVVVGW